MVFTIIFYRSQARNTPGILTLSHFPSGTERAGCVCVCFLSLFSKQVDKLSTDEIVHYSTDLKKT